MTEKKGSKLRSPKPEVFLPNRWVSLRDLNEDFTSDFLYFFHPGIAWRGMTHIYLYVYKNREEAGRKKNPRTMENSTPCRSC